MGKQFTHLFKWRTLGIAFVVLASGFWIWAFSPWARSAHPDKLSSDESSIFIQKAQEFCNGIFPDGIWEDGRPIQDLKTAQERAEFGRRSQKKLEDMNAELIKLSEKYLGVMRSKITVADNAEEFATNKSLPKNQQQLLKDRFLVTQWLSDWKSYLKSYDTWIIALEGGDPNAPPRQEARDGTRPQVRIEIFTNVNKMRSCAVPAFV